MLIKTMFNKVYINNPFTYLNIIQSLRNNSNNFSSAYSTLVVGCVSVNSKRKPVSRLQIHGSICSNQNSRHLSFTCRRLQTTHVPVPTDKAVKKRKMVNT